MRSSLWRAFWLEAAGAAAITCWICGCGQSAPCVAPAAEARAEHDAPPPPTWAEHIADLSLPDCPPGALLQVTTPESELSGGAEITDPIQAGETLSLLEALHIAANLSTPHTITFDADVFPADRLTALALGGAPQLGAPLCLDGRGAAVELGLSDAGLYFPEGSVLVGLSIVVGDRSLRFCGGQIAGCRFSNRSMERYVNVASIEDCGSGDITLGPHNVFTGPRALRLNAGRVFIRQSFFGFDPALGTISPLFWALDPSGFSVANPLEFTVEQCVFAVMGAVMDAAGNSSQVRMTFRDNQVGFEDAPYELGGVGVLEQGTYTIGPDNRIHGVRDAIWAQGTPGDTFVRVTRNSISGNTRGIDYMSSAPVAPPRITGLDLTGGRSTVSGVCPADGTFELFSDASDQGERFLVDGACQADTPWTVELPASAAPWLTRDRTITATLTNALGQTSVFSAPVPVAG